MIWKDSHPDGRVIDGDLNATLMPPIAAEWIGAVYTPEEAARPAAPAQIPDRRRKAGAGRQQPRLIQPSVIKIIRLLREGPNKILELGVLITAARARVSAGDSPLSGPMAYLVRSPRYTSMPDGPERRDVDCGAASILSISSSLLQMFCLIRPGDPDPDPALFRNRIMGRAEAGLRPASPPVVRRGAAL